MVWKRAVAGRCLMLWTDVSHGLMLRHDVTCLLVIVGMGVLHRFTPVLHTLVHTMVGVVLACTIIVTLRRNVRVLTIFLWWRELRVHKGIGVH